MIFKFESLVSISLMGLTLDRFIINHIHFWSYKFSNIIFNIRFLLFYWFIILVVHFLNRLTTIIKLFNLFDHKFSIWCSLIGENLCLRLNFLQVLVQTNRLPWLKSSLLGHFFFHDRLPSLIDWQIVLTIRWPPVHKVYVIYLILKSYKLLGTLV